MTAPPSSPPAGRTAVRPQPGGEGPETPRRDRSALRLALDHGVIVAFVAVFATLSLASDAFFTRENLLNLLEANADVGIVACAATLVVVAGGLDLSVGAIYAFAGVIAAEVTIEAGVLAGMLAGLCSGALLGAVNGLMVTAGRVNSFIATLTVGIVVRSLALVITGGFRVVPAEDSGFSDLGRQDLLGVSYVVWLFALTAIVTGAILTRGRFGRQVAVVGINPVVARLSGVAVERVRFLTFVLSGFAAGVAGVVITSRAGQGGADTAIGLELPVIAAIAIGGSSFAGGEGAVWRTVIGVLLIGLVANGLNLLGVDPRYEQLVLGVLVLLAVAVNLARRDTADRPIHR